MKLTFLGTRGFIEARTRRHRMHSSLMLSRGRARFVIDCGEDWSGRLDRLGANAIFVTHAHPDHACGLRDGAPCPVYASAAAWRGMRHFAIPARDRRVIAERRPLEIRGVRFEAVPVAHSLRAPAVGYRIGTGGGRLFYVPDVMSIPNRTAALRGIALYVGDGASLVRPIARARGRATIGHASIRTQLEWCAEARIRRAIFTHCGTQIVSGDARAVAARIRAMGAEHGVAATIAFDGMQVLLRDRGRVLVILRRRETPTRLRTRRKSASSFARRAQHDARFRVELRA